MTAIDAFHLKNEAYKGMHSLNWARFVDAFTASLRGEVPNNLGANDFHQSASDYSKALATTLSLAETFYVSPQMNALVTAAAKSWAEDETVEVEDFPTDYGWMYVPSGLTTLDIRGTLLTTSALTWARRGSEVEITFWADKRNDPPNMKAHPGWEEIAQFSPWHRLTLRLGQPLPTTLQMGEMLPPEVSAQIVWASDGSSAYFPEGWTADQMRLVTTTDPTTAWLVSALRIMQQPLASVEKKGLPANLRKSLMRHPVRVKNTSITVIEFRRTKGVYAEGTGREFSHRFLVRGHWRQQPYKREDGEWSHRRIWIHPHIKGPSDKPLILREHVNALTR